MDRGRPTSSSRVLVEDCACLLPEKRTRTRAQALPRHLMIRGLLEHSVDIQLSSNDGKQSTMRVDVTATYPHFGGFRYWFVCPKCGRRAGKLYAPDAGVLGCRVCLGLVYRVQYCKSATFRLFRLLGF